MKMLDNVVTVQPYRFYVHRWYIGSDKVCASSEHTEDISHVTELESEIWNWRIYR